MTRSNTREILSKFPNDNKTRILKAIVVLARTYAIAKSSPSRYAKYGFDFPGMIRIKVSNLYELNPDSTWIITFSDLMLKSLDSPRDIVNICTQYIEEMNHNSVSYANRKEYSYAYE